MEAFGHAVDDTNRHTDEAARSQSTLAKATSFLTSNWKILLPAVAAGAVGFLTLTGNMAPLLGMVPVLTALLAALLAPLASLAAILIGLIPPLTLFAALFGGLGAAFFLAGTKALGGGKQFQYLASQVSILKGEFAHLLRTLAGDFMPIFLDLVRAAQQAISYFNQLAKMPLADAFRSLATTGVSMLNRFVESAAHILARPFRLAVQVAFGQSGGLDHAMAGWAQQLSHYLFGFNKMVPSSVKGRGGGQITQVFQPGALQPIVGWFDKQNFTATGRRWGNQLAAGIVWSLGHALTKLLTSPTGAGAGAGAGIGAVLAAVFTDGIGAPLGAAIGAAIGGIIGHYLPKLRDAIKAALGPKAWGEVTTAGEVAWTLISGFAKVSLQLAINLIRMVILFLGVTKNLIVDLATKTGLWQVAVGLVKFGVSAVQTAVKVLPGMWNNVKQTISNVWNAIKNAASAVSGAFHSALSGVEGIANAILGVFQAIVGTVESIANKVASIHMPHLSIPSLPHIPGLPFATGGIVPGSGNRDSVPAVLTPGEMVLTRRQQAALFAGHAGGGGVTNINLNGPIIGTNPHLMARELARILQPHLGKTPSINVQGTL